MSLFAFIAYLRKAPRASGPWSGSGAVPWTGARLRAGGRLEHGLSSRAWTDEQSYFRAARCCTTGGQWRFIFIFLLCALVLLKAVVACFTTVKQTQIGRNVYFKTKTWFSGKNCSWKRFCFTCSYVLCTVFISVITIKAYSSQKCSLVTKCCVRAVYVQPCFLALKCLQLNSVSVSNKDRFGNAWKHGKKKSIQQVEYSTRLLMRATSAGNRTSTSCAPWPWLY